MRIQHAGSERIHFQLYPDWVRLGDLAKTIYPLPEQKIGDAVHDEVEILVRKWFGAYRGILRSPKVNLSEANFKTPDLVFMEDPKCTSGPVMADHVQAIVEVKKKFHSDSYRNVSAKYGCFPSSCERVLFYLIGPTIPNLARAGKEFDDPSIDWLKARYHQIVILTTGKGDGPGWYWIHPSERNKTAIKGSESRNCTVQDANPLLGFFIGLSNALKINHLVYCDAEVIDPGPFHST